MLPMISYVPSNIFQVSAELKITYGSNVCMVNQHRKTKVSWSPDNDIIIFPSTFLLLENRKFHLVISTLRTLHLESKILENYITIFFFKLIFFCLALSQVLYLDENFEIKVPQCNKFEVLQLGCYISMLPIGEKSMASHCRLPQNKLLANCFLTTLGYHLSKYAWVCVKRYV